jgi:hypothetical protein
VTFTSCHYYLYNTALGKAAFSVQEGKKKLEMGTGQWMAVDDLKVVSSEN